MSMKTAANVAMRVAVVASAFLASATIDAATPTFRIAELSSNLDGSVQFMRLTETAGLDDQHHLAGLTITSTHHGIVKTFTFDKDLPFRNTAHSSFVIGAAYDQAKNGNVVPVTFASGAWYCCYALTFSTPPRFFPTDGGTVAFADADSFEYSSLPTDGVHALLRDGGVALARLPTQACWFGAPGCSGEPLIDQLPVTAVEYYNAALDEYFLSASAPDIDALDSGRLKGWSRTGSLFLVGGTPNVLPGAVPSITGVTQSVCRYYLPPTSGDSHFMSASPDECAAVHEQHPDFVLETAAAFYAGSPDLASGQCPASYVDFNDNVFTWRPIYRLWNGRADTNHRCVRDLITRELMIEKGWISEGYGPFGVAFCVSGKNL
jgi:hypothetical protein